MTDPLINKLRKYNSYHGTVGRLYENKLKLDFTADQPYQKLVTDTTELKLSGQRVYLNPVMDLYSGEILSYDLSYHPNIDAVITPVKAAIRKLPKTKGVMIHSDQGLHYHNYQYQNLLKQNRIIQSMSRKSTCLDNAAMESFFHLLKIEVGTKFASRKALVKE